MPKTTQKPSRNFVGEKIEERTRSAKQQGLLNGKTRIISGRIPESLIAAAKENTGIKSDTELLKHALANIAVEDDYMGWIWSKRGSIDPEIDLEF
jgi:hypothetical protein